MTYKNNLIQFDICEINFVRELNAEGLSNLMKIVGGGSGK